MRFHEIHFKQMQFQLPIMKNKIFLSLKKIFFGFSQYQNKKALFTDSIFREGYGMYSHLSNKRGAHAYQF